MAKLTLDLLDGGSPLLLNLDFLVQADTDALYLAIANDLSDLNDAPTARTNIGLVAGGAGDIWVEKAGDTLTGILTSTNTTESTSVSTGSINTTGGIGVAKDAFIGGGLDIAGHTAIGASASIDSVTVLSINETISTTAPINATDMTLAISGSPLVGTAGVLFNLDGKNLQTPTLIDATQLRGINIVLRQNSATDMFSMYGFYSTIISAASTGNITGEVINFYASSGVYSGGKPAIVTGFEVANLGASGITDAHGIHITKQSGATNNYGILLDGDSGGSDIVFGAGKDASILYDGTDLVITPALVGSGVVNISTAGTALGSVLATIGNIPAGATAAQNEWLKIKVNGNIRYIPCWA